MTIERLLGRAAGRLLGESPPMQRLRRQAARVATYDVSVVLQGESGTGKEMLARAIHEMSRRRDGPFVGVNCAALHETLLESELFGHEAGAFTDARQARCGLLRAAHGGTILLDEAGEMSPSLQSKLLRVLEERAVVPVGGTQPVGVDVRVIAAAHRDLNRCVREGAFRVDLFYRLNVVRLCIPPLRQRRGDIPLLAEHLAGRMAELLKVPLRPISPAAMDLLVRYDWPGNVRELANVIQYAYVLGLRDVIDVEALPVELLGAPGRPGESFPPLREAIRRHVRQALSLSGGARGRAAQMLQVDRGTLRRMIRRYDLS